MQSRSSRYTSSLFAFVLWFAFVPDATADTVTAYKHCEKWKPVPENCSWHGATFRVRPPARVGAHAILGTAVWDHNSTQFDRNIFVSIRGIGTNQENARFETNPPWGSGAQPIPQPSPIGEIGSWEAWGRIDLPPNQVYMVSILSSKMGPGCYTISGPRIKKLDTSGETCSTNGVPPSVTIPDQIPVLAPDMIAGKFPGGGLWAAQFRLPRPAVNSGYIVQEVRFSESGTRPSGGQPLAASKHYWEAWPVAKGKEEITDPNSLETAATFVKDLTGVTLSEQRYQKYYNDVFANQYAAGSKGRAETRAVAAFYEGTLPQDFVPNNPQTNSGKLLSTTTSPTFWHGTGLMRLFTFEFDFQRARTNADGTLRAGFLPTGTMTSLPPMETAPD
jgi:hypothetical protein